MLNKYVSTVIIIDKFLQVDICLQHSEMDILFHLLDKDKSSSIDFPVCPESHIESRTLGQDLQIYSLSLVHKFHNALVQL